MPKKVFELAKELDLKPLDLVEKLKEITRSEYFERNVVPFLENKNTDLEMPKWVTKWNMITGLINRMRGNKDSRKPSYSNFNTWVAHDWLTRATKDQEHGDFVYVGSKEEVFLLGIAKNEDGSLYMQGTYTTSTKPMFYFSRPVFLHPFLPCIFPHIALCLLHRIFFLFYFFYYERHN